jgi:hypothetical protein
MSASPIDLSIPGDQLAWLVLRVVAELSPCTESSLIAQVLGRGDSKSERSDAASASHMQKVIGRALLTLKALAFVQFADKQIVIAEKGRRFLDALPLVGLSGDERSAKTNEPSETIEEIGRSLGTALLQIRETLNATNEVEVAGKTQKEAARFSSPGLPTLDFGSVAEVRVTEVNSELAIESAQGTTEVKGPDHPRSETRDPERSWASSVALLVTTSTARFAARCKQFRLNHFATPRSSTNAPLQGRTRRTQVLARLKAARGAGVADACVTAGRGWRERAAAGLRIATHASGLSFSLLRTTLAGLRRSHLIIIGGTLLVMCGTLLIVGSGILFSGGRAKSSRGSLIAWSFDSSDRPIEERSVFVTRNVGGQLLIEGISIRGENTSDQTLTAVKGAIKPDASNVELKLRVRSVGNQKNPDAPEIPPGGNFTLEFLFLPDASAQQTGIPAEVYLSEYGGAIFTFSYVTAAAQKTDIEYLSPERLKAQLAEVSGGMVPSKP